MTEQATQPSVAVLGGGYAGVSVAKALDAHLAVTLVEPKEAFLHNVASLRALAEPAWLPRIFLPYDGLLQRGRVIHDRAIKVEPGRVTLGSGEELTADFIVAATGSAYPFPAKSDLDATAAAQAKMRAAHEALAAAQRVLLIGAGPVGIELAGEITAAWPGKHVVLLDMASDLLGTQYSPELRAEIRRQLTEASVELRLGTALEGLPSAVPGERADITVHTSTGEDIQADIWFRCFGIEPASAYLVGDLAGACGPGGFVTVNDFLQVEGQRTIFALGDVATADMKMAGRAVRQAEVAAANILTLAAGGTELQRYQAGPPAIMLPLGPAGGAGERAGELISADAVAEFKGRTMMVDRFAELLGARLPE